MVSTNESVDSAGHRRLANCVNSAGVEQTLRHSQGTEMPKENHGKQRWACESREYRESSDSRDRVSGT